MQRKYLLSFIIGGILLLLVPNSTQARTIGGFFGKSEGIKCIQPVNEPPASKQGFSSNKPHYELCYKYTMYFVFAGIGLSDDGFVLAVGDGATQYIPLDKTKIEELQKAGYLPNPLPAYSIPAMQYLIGYSLWILLAGIIAFPVISFTGIALSSKFKHWKNPGTYCPGCDFPLTLYDFSNGKCSVCGMSVPEIQT